MTTNSHASAAASPPAGKLVDRLAALTVWGYLLALLAIWLAMVLAGDRWWLATVVLFSPRWLYAVPLALLLPWTLWRRQQLRVVAAAFAVWLLLIADLQVAWPGGGRHQPDLRVLSCNVRHWEGVSPDALRALIEELQPDIVALQEQQGPLPPLWPNTWHVRRGGDLVIASPHPFEEGRASQCSQRGMTPDHADVLCCVVQSPNARIRFANLHLTTPREGLERVLSRRTILAVSQRRQLDQGIAFRQRQSRGVHAFAVEDFAADVIAGDFNMPVASRIYRESWSRLTNAFSEVGWGFGYTKQTQIAGITYGLRIDHILTGLRWRPIRCWVERDIQSDHLPLVADLAMNPAPK